MLVDPYTIPVRLFTHETRLTRTAIFFRYRIEATTTPWVATRQASQSEPAPTQESELFYRFEKISGARGREATA